MTERKENKTNESKKSSSKKTEFWVALQEQLLDFGTLALKKGITNLALSKIDDTEEQITRAVEEKIQKHSKKIIKTLIKVVSYIIAASFLTYGILELILRQFDLTNYTNLIFGIIFLVVALAVNHKD